MKYKNIVLYMLAGALFLAGCTKNTETTTDEAAIQALIQGDYADYFGSTTAVNDSGSRDDTLTTSKSGTKGFIVGWGRQLTDVSTDISIQIDNDTANVTINRNLSGIFHVIWAPDSPGAITDSIKDFMDRSERYALFVREGDPDEPIRRGWRLKALSNVKVNTQNLPDSIARVNITKVEVTKLDENDNELETIELNDPSVLWNRDSIPVFLPGEKVRVRVYVDNTTPTVFAFLHYNTARFRHRRDRMIYNPDLGCFEGVWYTPMDTGIYHAAVDIIEQPSFYNSSYPYVSNIWLYVYRVSTE